MGVGLAIAGPTPAPRTEEMSFGRIRVTMTTDQAKVRLDREMHLTLTITGPSEVEAAIQPLNDRLQGFSVKATIEGEPSTGDGKTTRENRYLLTPMISDEYRIAPIAVTYTDKSKTPAESGWFATKALVFELLPPIDGAAPDKISASLQPVWVYPPLSTVLIWIIIAILAIGAVALLWRLTGHIKKQIKLMRMSPKERALHELSELLAKDLVGRNLVKEFYIELTMVVRRYIERQHRIRAPEQTTQEFMEAVSKDRRFGKEVTAKLKEFLEAADLVKFAAFQPPPGSIANATDTARDYIVTDADRKELTDEAERMKR
ncbi:MAG: hypothetical protein C0404_10170 [Verrucomicrobia bacterium]|nr:hypothetical protein [Verrucomicrobiota bacterium]